jgi:predicted  nucleic acid-binding Zn-ribbon protein
MGMVKNTYAEIWQLEKEILEAESAIDDHRRALEDARGELQKLWKKATSSKEVPEPIQKAIDSTCRLIEKEIPANIAKAQKRYDDKRELQKNAGVALHKYITKKLANARPGKYTGERVAYLTRLAEEMRHNFV